MRIFLALTILLSTLTFAQPANSGSGNEMPDLDSFTPDQVDKSLDPCKDFFQYACSKWLKANPIPVDQAGSGTFNQAGHLERGGDPRRRWKKRRSRRRAAAPRIRRRATITLRAWTKPPSTERASPR